MKEHKTHKNEKEVVKDKVKNNRIIIFSSSSSCFTGLELTARNYMKLSCVELQQFYIQHIYNKCLHCELKAYPFIFSIN